LGLCFLQLRLGQDTAGKRILIPHSSQAGNDLEIDQDVDGPR
jgi:hypothetical protein